jgi:dUTP pyrophosphatase
MPELAPARVPPAATHPPGALGADAIRRLLAADPPLVGDLADPERQIQPNGVDLTLASVWAIDGAGAIGATDEERAIPPRTEVRPDADGWYALAPGPYAVRLAEPVALPTWLMGLGRPRSSLGRCGVSLHTAVWDAGYRGRSESLMLVYNPAGFRVRRGARILQLVFFTLDRATAPYAGRYQGEGI